MTPAELGQHAHQTATAVDPIIASILAHAKKRHPDPEAQLIIRRAERGDIPLQLVVTISKTDFEMRLYAEISDDLFYLGRVHQGKQVLEH